MSSPYLEETFHPFLAARGGHPTVTWVTEREALGTGGAIVSALDRVGDEPFLALNGDILTDLDLTAMLARHRSSGADVTIALHRVEDARAFGLVATDAAGRITEFREKPPDPIAGPHQRGHLRPGTLRAAGVERWDLHLDRGRDLPRADRGWTIDGRVRLRRLLAGPRHAGAVPPGARRSARREGSGSCVRRPVDRPGRVGGSVGARREGPWRSVPGRRSRPTRRWMRPCSSPDRWWGRARGSCARSWGRVRRWVRAHPSSACVLGDGAGASPGAQLDGVRMSSDSAP